MRRSLFSDIKLAAQYYYDARTIYDVHSPFMYNFIKDVLDTKQEYYAFEDIENIRSRMSKMSREVEFKDFGAGSKSLPVSSRKVKDIATKSATNNKDGRILFNTAIHLGAKNIIELGTSLGLGTAYLASANGHSVVNTIEGDPASAYIAERNFELLGLKNVKLHRGIFNEILPSLLKNNEDVDLAFIDGDHNYENTLNYFNILKEGMSEKGIIIMDDIYWSKGMNLAWIKIIKDRKVTASLNIFSKGFIFLDPAIKTEKKHEVIIPIRWKPWRIGLFG